MLRAQWVGATLAIAERPNLCESWECGHGTVVPPLKLIRLLHCPPPESPRTLRAARQNSKRLHVAGREVRMRGWKRVHVFNWELMFTISSLVLAFMAVGALLIYESFVRAR